MPQDFEEIYAEHLDQVWRFVRARVPGQADVEMTGTPAQVSDGVRRRLLAELTPGQYAELASAIAWENHRARLNRALGVRAMGFAEGGFCVLPERAPSGSPRDVLV